MNVSLEKDYYLRISDFDRYGKLKASSILDIFQDIAASHANDLGIGFDAMMANETVWVLTKVKFEVFGQPSMYQTVHVKTWPLAPEKIVFRREYHITNDAGKTLIKGTSEWCVMHSVKRRLVSAVDAFPIKEGFITETMFEDKLKKVTECDSTDEPYITKTTFSDCDVNGHVNNTKYANYIFDSLNLPEDKNVKTLQMDYHQEVISGTELHIHTQTDGNEILAKGMGDDDKKKFSCHIILG